MFPSSTNCQHLHRRDFLHVGTAGLLGLTLAEMLELEARAAPPKKEAKAQCVIMLWLGGGPATIDMWDLKPEAPQNIRGEFKPIETKVRGVLISEFLPRMAEVMDRCALVRSLSHEITAHGPGTLYMATGHTPSATFQYPSLGSLAVKLLPGVAGVPPYVMFPEARTAGFSGGAGFLGPSYNPFEVQGSGGREKMRFEGIALPDGFTLDMLTGRAKLRDRLDARFKALDESDVPASLDRFQQQALDILRSDKTRRAFDLEQEKQAVREAYGPAPLARGLLIARRLVEAGARFVTVGLSGWDTHANNFATLRNQLLPQLDRALAALIADLNGSGLFDTTIVYCAGEFGRTPRINNTAGRDHWARAMSVLLAGGGLKRGVAYGRTDSYGMAPASEACSPADVAATIFQRLGIPPEYELQTASGRPLPIFRDGKAIQVLMG